MTSRMRQVFDLLIAPRARLRCAFPWGAGKFARAYVLTSLWFYAGALILPLALFALLIAAVWIGLPLTETMGRFVFDFRTGEVRFSFLVALTVLSFVAGFAAQVAYIRKVMHRDGMRLRDAMAINLDSLRGSTPLATAWAVTWRVVVAWLVWVAFQQVAVAMFGAPQQGTMDLFRAASGGNFWALALIAVVGAPLFEEIVFRGFLFNSLRSTLSQGRLFRLLVGSRLAADYAAVFISSAMFALGHMQFHPVTLLLLFSLGCILAELYRRSGSLWCPILLHALNNGITVLILAGQF